jgi:hypothetical protein
MFNIKIKKQNKKIILSLILIVFYSLSTFAQTNQGWKPGDTVDSTPTDTNPGSPSDTDDPVGTPIDDNILALLVLGVGFGIYKIQTKKDKIIYDVA